VRAYVRFAHVPIMVITGADLDQRTEDELEHHGVRRIFRKGSYQFAEIRSAIDEALASGAGQ
jgi:hypothetical protein